MHAIKAFIIISDILNSSIVMMSVTKQDCSEYWFIFVQHTEQYNELYMRIFVVRIRSMEQIHAIRLLRLVRVSTQPLYL